MYMNFYTLALMYHKYSFYYVIRHFSDAISRKIALLILPWAIFSVESYLR